MNDTTQDGFSSILPTGNAFIVTAETVNNIFGPGTKGLMNYVKGADNVCANIAHVQVLIIRRGKYGMPRLDTNLISTPIFKSKNMESIIKTLDKKQKYYIHTEPAKLSARSIYELSNLEYLGWGTCWAKYVYKLSQQVKHLSVWPAKKSIVVDMFNICSLWKSDSQLVVNTVCTNEARKEFVTQMRMLEATLANYSLSYMTKTAEMEVNALFYLMNYEKGETYNKKRLVKTYDVFVKKYTNLKALKDKNDTVLKKNNKFF